MSQEIGPQLPPPLRFELGAHPTGLPKAVLLLSTDNDGSPRVAMLGVAEITVRDPSHLQVRVRKASTSCANIRRAKKAGLWYVLDAAAYCIRGNVQARGEQPEFTLFEMTISSVLRDFEPEAPMVSGPTYKRV